ncbi:hypothetical protein [Candidatus Poriferisodalis sp.]|uniref:hypothetical protein n=1 Tax=Candidatus Poriferisodalis sp. TaxID=3101277 RepID=UPI003B5A3133
MAALVALAAVLVLVVLGLSGVFRDSAPAEADRVGVPVVDDPEFDYMQPVTNELGRGRTLPPSGEFVDVSVNGLMSCGVRVGGELVCWGDVRGGLPEGEFSRVVLFGGGYRVDASGCALRTDGSVECWAGPGWEHSAPAVPGGVFVDVSAGQGRWCAVDTGGGVVCWGAGFDGHEVLAGSGFVRVLAGSGYDGSPAFSLGDDGLVAAWSDDPVCALDAEGGVRCWGVGPPSVVSGVPSGLFGSVSAASYRAGGDSPVRWGDMLLGSAVAGDEVSDRVVGDVCGVRPAGRLECWGLSGQPTFDVPAGEFIKVAVGARHGCGLAADGAVRCWGANEAGQRGAVRNLAFEWLVGDVSCSRDEQRRVTCSRWGTGALVPRSDPSHPYRDVPDSELDPLGGPFADVWVTDAGSCASQPDEVLVCWGDLGAGFDPALGPFGHIVSGRLHGCGLRTDGTVACWKVLDESLLDADAASVDADAAALRDYYAENWTAQDAAPNGTFTQIAAGELHTCALDRSGGIACWGNLEGHGQAPRGPFTQISAAGTATCALDSESRSACWGKVHDAPVPALAPFDDPSARIVATVDAERPCMVSTVGVLDCTGAQVVSVPPWWVGPLSSAIVDGWTMCGIREQTRTFACWDIATGAPRGGLAGTYAQVDQKRDGIRGIGLRCWIAVGGGVGCAYIGHPGDLGYEMSGAVPSETPHGTFVKIAVSEEHGCAIRVDRTIACWGYEVSFHTSH